MPSILTAVRDLERLRQIVAVLVRHGFGELVQRAGWGAQLGIGKKTEEDESRPKPIGVGERIRLVLTELGPSFVKLGQIVSTRPDLVPAEIIDELRKLQDDVPPVAFAEVRPMLERELGATVEELFEAFDERPLASASIGQVHRAVTASTPEGPSLEVVVKVQRPERRGHQVDRRTSTCSAAASRVLIEGAVPESRIYSPTCASSSDFDRSITRRAQLHASRPTTPRSFARGLPRFRPRASVHFPTIYRQDRAPASVLTHGVPRRHEAAGGRLAAGHGRQAPRRVQAIAVVHQA